MASQKRRKFQHGKAIKDLHNGEYEITLFIDNTGPSVIEGMQIIDKVPQNFQHGKYSIIPEVESSEIQVLLRWGIPALPRGGHWEVGYHIWGSGEYKVENAQFIIKPVVL